MGDPEGSSPQVPQAQQGRVRDGGTGCGGRPLARLGPDSHGGAEPGVCPRPTGLFPIWAEDYLGDKTLDFSLSRASDTAVAAHTHQAWACPTHCTPVPTCPAARLLLHLGGCTGHSLSGSLGRWPGRAWFTEARGSGALGGSGNEARQEQACCRGPCENRTEGGRDHED